MKAIPIMIMLVALFFKKLNAEWIITDRMKNDERIGDYIELHEHDTLRLGCLQFNDNIMFTVPVTNTNRITEYSNSSSSGYKEKFLTVENVTESDTGTYTCHSSKNQSSNDTVYVFVHSSKVFVPHDHTTIPFIEEGSVIPCRTTQLVNHENVRLYANKHFIQTDWDDYDPRYGFRIRDTMQDDDETNTNIFFLCSFKNETYQEFEFFSVREWIHPTDDKFINNSEIDVNEKESKSDVLLNIGRPFFPAFNDYFFRKDSQVEISCTRSFTNHAEDFLLYRTKRRSNYKKLNPSKCELLSVTSDRGKKQRCSYNLKLVEDIQVECRNNEKNSSETAYLYLADRFLTTRIETIDGKYFDRSIFIEDDVNLVCVIPVGPSDWNVYWRKSNETEKNLTTTMEFVGTSKHIIHSIRNITTNEEGTYECVIEKDEMSLVLKKTIVDFRGILIPDMSCLASLFPVKGGHSLCRYNHSVNVNERIELECHFGGRPDPKYQWYKDGLPYTHGVKNGSRLIIANAREEDDGIFQCHVTVPGNINTTTFTGLRVYGLPEDRFLSYKTILFLAGLVSVMLICFAYICVQYKTIKQKNAALLELYKKLNRKSESLPTDMMNLPVEERTDFLEYNHEYEVDIEKLEILEHLGEGQFGLVNRGLLQKADPHSLIEYKIRLQVAVKRAKKPYNIEEQLMMVDELKVMCAIPRHPNVVALVGAVTKHFKKGILYVITEYIDGGNLRNYLRKLRSNFKDELCNNDVPENESCEKDELLIDTFDSLSTSDLLSIGLQIASGMEWLASVPCVHRDLACRNVLITKTKIIRIADFGLTKKFASKSYYRLKTETRLPIPTMSPEAIDDLKFTEKSDVWSFGLCLYEIFTLGGTPYPNCGSIQEIIEFIENGNRNVQPKYCPDEIYKLMELCWKTSPKKRPTFKKCVKVFKDYMQKEVVQKIERNLQLESEEQQELDSWIGKSLKEEGVEDKEIEVLDKL